MVKPKPAFLQSGLFFIALYVVVFFGAISLGAGIQNAARAAFMKQIAKATLPVAEFRSLVSEAQKTMLAGSFTYSFQHQYDWNRGPQDFQEAEGATARIEVQYNKDDNTTIVSINPAKGIRPYQNAYEKGIAIFLPGRYTFNDNNFASYFDFDSYSFDYERNPSAIEVERVVELLPTNLFFRNFLNAKDEDMSSQSKPDNDLVELQVSGAPVYRIFVNKNTHKITSGVTSNGINVTFSY
jgi:hypothetical protein